MNKTINFLIFMEKRNRPISHLEMLRNVRKDFDNSLTYATETLDYYISGIMGGV